MDLDGFGKGVGFGSAASLGRRNLEVVSSDGGYLKLRIVPTVKACEDCLVPSKVIEQIVKRHTGASFDHIAIEVSHDA